MTRRLSSNAPAVANVILVWLLCACAATPALPLNSERIAASFGSYGIEVLKRSEQLRVSDLYSGADETRVTRTFAVVQYPEVIDARLSAAHAEILGGGSIGAVLAAAGWRINKRNRFYTEVIATPRLQQLMHLGQASSLAMHMYVLEAQNGATRIDYAVIAEIHHPEYLSLEQTHEIYGAVPRLTQAQQARVSAVVALVTAEIAEQD